VWMIVQAVDCERRAFARSAGNSFPKRNLLPPSNLARLLELKSWMDTFSDAPMSVRSQGTATMSDWRIGDKEIQKMNDVGQLTDWSPSASRRQLNTIGIKRRVVAAS
jgi:hypothetical protein